MDELIIRATNLIGELLKHLPWDFSGQVESQLIETRNLLGRLLEPNIRTNNWTRLFIRQLERLLNYHDSLPPDFWIALYNDLLYILGKVNGEENKNDKWIRFLQRMQFETELEERELKFHQIFGERKSLSQLIKENEEFIKLYLQKCISFHLKIQIRNVIQNVHDLFCNDYGLTDYVISSEDEKKLIHIEIPFNCSNRSLNNISFSSSTNETNNVSSYLPSTEAIQVDKSHLSVKIFPALEHNRWLVILGEPGSAKTTLVRWITRVFAEAAYRKDEKIYSREEGSNLLVRIPILIRIGEFAEWLNQYPEKTLFDYIGEHTWFSQRYCSDQDKNILKDFVHHGHALILLDGLDEIPEVKQRKDIVQHVYKFIEEYIRTSNFISAFDNALFTIRWPFSVTDINLLGIPSPCNSLGNQIVLTSRSIGYQLYPLLGPSIVHSALSLVNHKEAQEFVKDWIFQVGKVIQDILIDEGYQLDKEITKNLSEKRYNQMKTILENGSNLLMSNPALLSLICTTFYQSSDQYLPKSRVEIYHRIVQSALKSWKNNQLNISENILINFLIDLASYLHLQSSSGLIDAFDMKQLCYLSLLKQNLINNNRQELRKYVDKFLSLLDLNIGIVVERSLFIYGFLHLSFQEYFVAQCLLRDSSSINQITKRILTFFINPRFRQSILFTLNWISWKWSDNDYNQFCYCLLDSNTDYAIPYGTILLFDAFKDLQKLPSNSIILKALDSLIDHPSDIITSTYLSSNLFQLDKDLIIQWMNVCFENEKHFYKFCKCLLRKYSSFHDKSDPFNFIILPSIVRQQLEIFYNMNTSLTFIIDQTLRKTYTSKCNQENLFSSSDIHPLIFSLLIALYHGIRFDEDEDIFEVNFSSNKIYRQSSILPSILIYLQDNERSHSIKIQELIKYHENILENSAPTDTSIIIIDTFVTLICLQGLEDLSIYHKYSDYLGLSMALERFKWIWFYLKSSYYCVSYNCRAIDFFFKSQIESSILENDDQRTAFSFLCTMTCNKFEMDPSSNDYDHSIHWINLRNMSTNIYSSDQIQENLFLLLTFLPQSLQQLYYKMFFSPSRNSKTWPLVVLLSECLIYFDEIKDDSYNFSIALSILQPIFEKHLFENSLAIYSSLDQSKDWQVLIDTERQRIFQAKDIINIEDKDVQLFSASISLARLFQVQQQTNNRQFSSFECEEMNDALNNISNPILHILAQNMIFKSHQIIDQLTSLLPSLSLLESTLLFVRCYSCEQDFQHSAKILGEKLSAEDDEDRAIAFIVLRQLNNCDLNYYLTELNKRKINLSNILHFNSTIFHRYLTKSKSLDSIFFSILYLIELTFDAQILQNNKTNNKEKFSLNNFKIEKIMTLKFALWITEYLKMSNKEELNQIISHVSSCLDIEENALPIIETWLNYHYNKELQFFAQYAALQLIIKGSNHPNTIMIIEEIFSSDCKYRSEPLFTRLFNSSSVDLTIIRQILILLNEHIQYSLQINIGIYRKDMLELVLNLEYQRIIINRNKITRSYLSIITDFSKDLFPYIKEHIEHHNQEEYLTIIIKWIMTFFNRNNFQEDIYKYIFTFLTNEKYPRIQQAICYSLNSILIDRNISKEDIFIFDNVRNSFENIICSYDIYDQVTLSICLLTYTHYLIQLDRHEIDKLISDQIQNSLRQIFHNSSSIRSAFCLIFIEQSNITTVSISRWFERNKSNLTSKEIYDILLQQTLYKQHSLIYYGAVEDVAKHLEIHSEKLIEIFLSDFYNYLCYQHKIKYNLLDCKPDYTSIALQLIDRNYNLFLKSLKKSSIKIETFQNELYNYFSYTTNPIESNIIIKIYASLGVLTVQLINMLKWIKYWSDEELWKYFNYIEDISDQDVSVKLFELLDLLSFDTTSKRFSDLLKFIIHLAENHLISLSEVQQRIALLVKKISYGGDSMQWFDEKYILNTLLTLTCLQNNITLNSESDFNTQEQINQDFDQVYQRHQKQSALFCMKNHFLNNFQPT